MRPSGALTISTREHPPENGIIKHIDEYEIDCEVGEDQKPEEMFRMHQPEEIRPEMSKELQGIDDGVALVEEWHASCLAHEATVADKSLPPQIPEHPDRPKSTRQQEACDREESRHGYLGKSVAAHERHSGLEEQAKRRFRIPRSLSTHNLSLLMQQVGQETASVTLFMYGQAKGRITVSEHISRENLRKEGSKMLGGRVHVVSETDALKYDTAVVFNSSGRIIQRMT
jgi:hypothetical protein